MDEFVRIGEEDKEKDEWVRVGNVADLAGETIRARTWKDTVSEVAHETIPPLAAGIVGTPTYLAQGGTPAGLPTAAMAGGAAYMGAEGLLDTVDRNVLGINDRPPPTWKEQAALSAGDFFTGALSTGIQNRTGPWLQGAAKGILAPYSETMTPERMSSIKELGSMGYNTSPGMMTGSRMWSIIERWGRRVPGSAGAFEKIDRANLVALIDRRNELLGLGDTSTDVSVLNRMINEQAEAYLARQKNLSAAQVEGYRRMLQRSLASGRRVEDATLQFLTSARDRSNISMLRKNAAYQTVNDYIPSLDPDGTPINRIGPDSEVVQVARDIVRTEGQLPAMKDSELVTAAKNIVSAVEPTPPPTLMANGQPLWEMPDGTWTMTPPERPPLTWEALQTMKARFSDAVNDPMRGGMVPGAKGQVTSVGRQWARLADALDQDMEGVANSVSDEARGAWRAAKALNARYKGLYGSDADFWNSIGKSNNPAELFGVAETIFSNRETRRLAIELGGEDAVRNLERAYTGNLIQQATGTVGGFDPKKLAAILDKQDQAMLAQMWGRNGLQAVKNALRGAVDAEAIPKSVWQSLTKEDAIGWLLNTNRPNRIKGVIRMLDPATVDGLRGQYLITTLGGQGAFGVKAKTLGLPNEINVGAVTGNLKASDELGKSLFPADDMARLRSFRDALRLLGEYYGKGFDPGSGVHLTTSAEVGGFLQHPIAKTGEWLTRAIMVKGYYSNLLKDWVTRRVVSPEQAAQWGGLLNKYLAQPAVMGATGRIRERGVPGIVEPRRGMPGAIPLKDEFVRVDPALPTPAPEKYPESQKLDTYQPQVWGQDRPMTMEEIMEWQRQMEGDDEYLR